MLYKAKPRYVNAIQWNKDGDHPDVVFVELDQDGIPYGEIALPLMWEVVNSGDYIVDTIHGQVVMRKEDFEAEFELAHKDRTANEPRLF